MILKVGGPMLDVTLRVALAAELVVGRADAAMFRNSIAMCGGFYESKSKKMVRAFVPFLSAKHGNRNAPARQGGCYFADA
jgi:hypothetical protein